MNNEIRTTIEPLTTEAQEWQGMSAILINIFKNANLLYKGLAPLDTLKNICADAILASNDCVRRAQQIKDALEWDREESEKDKWGRNKKLLQEYRDAL
jgi:hypothetical protein